MEVMADVAPMIVPRTYQTNGLSEAYCAPKDHRVKSDNEFSKPKKTKARKLNICQFSGWLITINRSHSGDPARYCVLGRVSSLTYNNVKNLLKNPQLDDEGYVRLLEDIAMVTISPKKALLFFDTMESAFLPDGNVIEIVNVDRIECTQLSTRSFSISDGKKEVYFLVEHPQSASEWIKKIETIKEEPSDILEEEKKSQVSNILKKIKLAEAAAAKSRIKGKMKLTKGLSIMSNKEDTKTKPMKPQRAETSDEAGDDEEGYAERPGAESANKGVGIFQRLMGKLRGHQQTSTETISEKLKESNVVQSNNIHSAEEWENRLESIAEEDGGSAKKQLPLSALIINDNKPIHEPQVPYSNCQQSDNQIELTYTVKPVNIKQAVTKKTKRYSYMADIGNINELPYDDAAHKLCIKPPEKTLQTPPGSSEVSSENSLNGNMCDFKQNSEDIKKQEKVDSEALKVTSAMGKIVNPKTPKSQLQDVPNNASWDESFSREMNKSEKYVSNTKGASTIPKMNSDTEAKSSEPLSEAKSPQSDNSNDECINMLRNYEACGQTQFPQKSPTPQLALDLKYKPFLGMRSSVTNSLRKVNVDEECASVETMNSLSQLKLSKWKSMKIFSLKSGKTKSHSYAKCDTSSVNMGGKKLKKVQKYAVSNEKAVKSIPRNMLPNTLPSKNKSPSKDIQRKRKEFLGSLANFLVLWRTLHNSSKINGKNSLNAVENQCEIARTPATHQSAAAAPATGVNVSNSKTNLPQVNTSNNRANTPASPEAQSNTCYPTPKQSKHKGTSTSSKDTQILRRQDKNLLFGIQFHSLSLGNPFSGKITRKGCIQKSTKSQPSKVKLTSKQTNGRRKLRKSKIATSKQ